MTKLEQLIQEKCPNGVEWLKIEDVAKYEQPGDYIVQSTNYDDSYETPVLTAGQSFVLGYTNETDGHYEASKENPVIIFDDFTGAFKWVDFDFKVKSSAMKMIKTNDKVLIRFLYHWMGKVNYTSSEHKRLWISTYSQALLPVPPLEVQREIVEILDKFSSNGLDGYLKKEFELRKKQYEYYKNYLIANSTNNIVKIKDIAVDIYRGSGIKRDEVTSEGTPCVRYGEIYTTYDTLFEECVSHTKENVVSNPKYFEHGDILFAITGESVEDIAKSIAYLGNDKCLAGGDTVVLKHNQEPRYLAYALSTSDAIMQKGKGKVKSKVVHSNVPSILDISIPLPEINEQKRIADILDRFHQILNNTSDSIPAEIELRQKQFMYYRDKLLSFKRENNN